MSPEQSLFHGTSDLAITVPHKFLCRISTRRLFFTERLVISGGEVADVYGNPQFYSQSRIRRLGVRNWVQMPISAP